MNLKHLVILLLCCQELAIAGFAIDSEVNYQYSSEWVWPASFFIKENPDGLLSSSIAGDLSSDPFTMNYLSLIDEDDTAEEIQIPRFSSPEYYQLPVIKKDALQNDAPENDAFLRRSMVETDSTQLQYTYENDEAKRWLLDYSSSVGRFAGDEIDYIDSGVAEASTDLVDKIAPLTEGMDEYVFRTGDSYGLQEARHENITQLVSTFAEAHRTIGASAIAADDHAAHLLSSSIDPYLKESLPESSYILENLPTPRSNKDKKNYAIVVGIDEYKDRMSLHTCANDARSIADLMSELGYDVVLLSDQTEDKPTKSNILDMAFEEIKNKKNIGNVVFYFSGHGIKEDDDTFYLIPQDANGDASTYISEYELKQQIKDFKNLAMIIDACNSEGLSPAIGDGQLIIASSQSNQSSNGEWTGSMSVFTSSLIKAIREEKKSSNKVLLQRCFDRAYSDTVRWSRSHLISQTPVLVDLTGGIYFIN